jgi:hypothetical protein
MQPDLEIGPPADKIDLRTHDIHRRPATPAPSGDSEPPAAPTPARPGMQPVQKRWIRVYPDREDQPTKKK